LSFFHVSPAVSRFSFSFSQKFDSNCESR
jgi:hypothetical protein